MASWASNRSRCADRSRSVSSSNPPQPVAHGLRVHVQDGRGAGKAAAAVEPGAERDDELGLVVAVEVEHRAEHGAGEAQLVGAVAGGEQEAQQAELVEQHRRALGREGGRLDGLPGLAVGVAQVGRPVHAGAHPRGGRPHRAARAGPARPPTGWRSCPRRRGPARAWSRAARPHVHPGAAAIRSAVVARTSRRWSSPSGSRVTTATRSRGGSSHPSWRARTTATARRRALPAAATRSRRARGRGRPRQPVRGRGAVRRPWRRGRRCRGRRPWAGAAGTARAGPGAPRRRRRRAPASTAAGPDGGEHAVGLARDPFPDRARRAARRQLAEALVEQGGVAAGVHADGREQRGRLTSGDQELGQLVAEGGAAAAGGDALGQLVAPAREPRHLTFGGLRPPAARDRQRGEVGQRDHRLRGRHVERARTAAPRHEHTDELVARQHRRAQPGARAVVGEDQGEVVGLDRAVQV